MGKVYFNITKKFVDSKPDPADFKVDPKTGKPVAFVEFKADEPKVYAELGRVYLQMKSYPEAKKQLDHALALDPENYEANFALLRFYSFTDDPRREEQSKRFADIKKNREKLYLESMRVIEARPETESP